MKTQNTSFYDLGIAPKMLSVLDSLKFVAPTPIQHKSIPVALEDCDLVGIAQTGTGKTLSFGIPMIQRLEGLKGSGLVLVPTRELALQVSDALEVFLKAYGMTCVTLIGGAPMGRQIKKLKKHVDVIVATPGRLIDHLERKTVKLSKVRVLVLDEADRMFDMGFAPQVRKILESVPKERQTMLYSATMPPAIIGLATKHLRAPTHIEIAPEGTTAEGVSQELFIVKEEDKKDLLEHLLKTYRGSVLLFVRTKIRAARMKKRVSQAGHQAAEIHSDRTMGQRKQAIEGFKSGKFRVLVATDVAARGIDVQMIELVINYDLPDDSENYVHRIGRTGRGGDKGFAITFATPQEGAKISEIEKLIRMPLPLKSHPELASAAFEKEQKGGKSKSGRSRNRNRNQKRSSGRSRRKRSRRRAPK